jgi:hypothetical protein
MKIAQQIKKEFAKSIRARVRETKAVGLTGTEVRKDILDMLDRFIKS